MQALFLLCIQFFWFHVPFLLIASGDFHTVAKQDILYQFTAIPFSRLSGKMPAWIE